MIHKNHVGCEFFQWMDGSLDNCVKCLVHGLVWRGWKTKKKSSTRLNCKNWKKKITKKLMIWVVFISNCLIISYVLTGNEGMSAGSDLTGAIFFKAKKDVRNLWKFSHDFKNKRKLQSPLCN